MKEVLKQLKNAVWFSLSVMSLLGVGFLFVQADWQSSNPSSTDSNLFVSGTGSLTLDKWNALVAEVDYVKNKSASGIDTIATDASTKATNAKTTAENAASTIVAIPSDTIGAFYMTTCPSGWSPADGTNGNPDLRGQFLRGLNTFDGGTTIRSDGYQDPDGNTRLLGSYQADEIKKHTHTIYIVENDSPAGAISYRRFAKYGSYSNYYTANSGGVETRPKNVAMIFCVKD